MPSVQKSTHIIYLPMHVSSVACFVLPHLITLIMFDEVYTHHETMQPVDNWIGLLTQAKYLQFLQWSRGKEMTLTKLQFFFFSPSKQISTVI
jgi:hypothetical protein